MKKILLLLLFSLALTTTPKTHTDEFFTCNLPTITLGMFGAPAFSYLSYLTYKVYVECPAREKVNRLFFAFQGALSSSVAAVTYYHLLKCLTTQLNFSE